jgi:hypothetical protein
MPFLAGLGNPQAIGGAADFSTLSQDLTSTADGIVTLAEGKRIITATRTLSADGTGADGAIVGSGNGSLGAASVGNSFVLVAAPGAGKRIMVLEVEYQYTFVTAAYTAGGNCNIYYGGSVGQAFSGNITAVNSFGLGTSGWGVWRPSSGIVFSGVGATPASNCAVHLRSSAAFTQPGTAAGTATIKTRYVVVDG